MDKSSKIQVIWNDLNVDLKVILPLLHLDDLIPVESSHLELPVEVPHGESHKVLVSDSTLHSLLFRGSCGHNSEC